MAMKTGRRRKTPVTLPQFEGDHGPKTSAQTRGTVMEAVEDDKNNMGRRRRVDWLKVYHEGHKGGGSGRIAPFLTLRQYQAGQAIRDAWENTMRLPEQTGERVDSSPKPDQRTTIQVIANQKYAEAMDAVPQAARYVVEHVCHNNMPMSLLRRYGHHKQVLAGALERVADAIGY